MAHSPLFRKFVSTLQEARRLNLQAEGKPLPISRPNQNWSRRRFVRSLTLAGGSALASSSLTQIGRAWAKGKQPATQTKAEGRSHSQAIRRGHRRRSQSRTAPTIQNSHGG